MEYNFTEIEAKWQQHWQQSALYRTSDNHQLPKYYVLSMFPYPSGSGLHVGHPLGYIAADILARYKRLQGFNVLHPMGFDAFGLPAENYAIQTGQAPAVTTQQNIATYRKQLQNLGLSYDWEREVVTTDPTYYRWTQWIVCQMFDSWYNLSSNRAEPISTLVAHLQQHGTDQLHAHHTEHEPLTAQQWNDLTPDEQQRVLIHYRLFYPGEGEVWYCPALGTVLANDEVKDGYSERGGHPVERRKLPQWFLRMSAYAQRLLDDLEGLDWSDAIKDYQRNWIGRSEGALIDFFTQSTLLPLSVFTTRPDTIFGVTFMVVAPEHELVAGLITESQKHEIENYINYVKKRSEIERQSDKRITGAFTGSYVLHPFTQQPIPVYISEYVLAGYGTGAIMAVPSSDERDYRFAQHFDLPIVHVIEGSTELDNPTELKRGTTINSDFLDGLPTDQAISRAIAAIEERKIGSGKVNFRMRDANFSRQRYWGEPIPAVRTASGAVQMLPTDQLPVVLPAISAYGSRADGKSPLAGATEWLHTPQGERETDTLPGAAGSSWYFLRYMDPHNTERFAAQAAVDYWQQVDFYVGGSEHAGGHLLYARMWNKFLYDRNWVPTAEPFQRLFNQGMIQGRSSFVYRIKNTNTFVTATQRHLHDTTELHVDVALVQNDLLDMEGFRAWREEYRQAQFLTDANGTYQCGWAIEKMSKSKHNVVNPDDMIAKYGCDCFRMFEMFLGPIEMSKPWNTDSIEGTSRFLRKMWRLFNLQADGTAQVSDQAPSAAELKVLHRTIKTVSDDIARFSLNTCVSSFMKCVNDLSDFKCHNRHILQSLCQLMAPFAPYITEELWQRLGNTDSIHRSSYPHFEAQYLVEATHNYPIQINGKVRGNIDLPANCTELDAKTAVLADPNVQKWTMGNEPRKFVFVAGRIVNIVL